MLLKFILILSKNKLECFSSAIGKYYYSGMNALAYSYKLYLPKSYNTVQHVLMF
jgi:hypothetical protein